MTLQDSSHLFYPPCINACPTMTLCPTMTFLSPLYVFTPIGHLRPSNFVQSSSYFPTLVKSKSDSLLYSFFEKYWSVQSVSQWRKVLEGSIWRKLCVRKSMLRTIQRWRSFRKQGREWLWQRSEEVIRSLIEADSCLKTFFKVLKLLNCL